jgi:DegV family protein with EDD domain
MAVAVITDSAAALDKGLTERFDITVVPMRLTIGGTTYPDDQVTLEEVVRRIDEGVHTAGPAPGAFAEAIEARQSGDGVVVLTVSERMSSTHKAALLAAESAGGEVQVVDTTTAAGAEALVVLAAAEAAGHGEPLDEVVNRARLVSGRVRLVAAVNTLKYLVRSGRLPDIAGRAGTYLGLRPLFEFQQGGIRPLRPSLSRDAALEQLLNHWRRSKVRGAPLHVAALHAAEPESAQHMIDVVRSEVEPATAFVGSFGPVMIVHTGPLTGLAWWWG